MLNLLGEFLKAKLAGLKKTRFEVLDPLAQKYSEKMKARSDPALRSEARIRPLAELREFSKEAVAEIVKHMLFWVEKIKREKLSVKGLSDPTLVLTLLGIKPVYFRTADIEPSGRDFHQPEQGWYGDENYLVNLPLTISVLGRNEDFLKTYNILDAPQDSLLIRKLQKPFSNWTSKEKQDAESYMKKFLAETLKASLEDRVDGFVRMGILSGYPKELIEDMVAYQSNKSRKEYAIVGNDFYGLQVLASEEKTEVAKDLFKNWSETLYFAYAVLRNGFDLREKIKVLTNAHFVNEYGAAPQYQTIRLLPQNIQTADIPASIRQHLDSVQMSQIETLVQELRSSRSEVRENLLPDSYLPKLNTAEKLVRKAKDVFAKAKKDEDFILAGDFALQAVRKMLEEKDLSQAGQLKNILDKFNALAQDETAVTQKLIEAVLKESSRAKADWVKLQQAWIDFWLLHERTEISIRVVKHEAGVGFDLREYVTQVVTFLMRPWNKTVKQQEVTRLDQVLRYPLEQILTPVNQRVSFRKPDHAGPIFYPREALILSLSEAVIWRRGLKKIKDLASDEVFQSLLSEKPEAGERYDHLLTRLTISFEPIIRAKPLVNKWDLKEIVEQAALFSAREVFPARRLAELSKLRQNPMKWLKDQGVQLSFDIPEGVKINVSHTLFQQAMETLIKNSLFVAQERLEDENKRRAAAHRKQLTFQDRPVKLEVNLKDGQLQLIEVSDNVGGVSDEDALQSMPLQPGRQNITQLNYSRRKKDTGFGLAFVWHVMNMHGGQFSIKNKLMVDGKTVEGIVATITLPRADVRSEMREDTAVEKPIQISEGNSTREILHLFSHSMVVGDEGLARNVAAEIQSRGLENFIRLLEKLRDEMVKGLNQQEQESIDQFINWSKTLLNQKSLEQISIGLDVPDMISVLSETLGQIPLGEDVQFILPKSMRLLRFLGLKFKWVSTLKNHKTLLPTLESDDGEQASLVNPSIIGLISKSGGLDAMTTLGRQRMDAMVRLVVAALIAQRIKNRTDLSNAQKQGALFSDLNYFGNLSDAVRFDEKGRVLVDLDLMLKLAQEFQAKAQVQQSA